MIPAAFRRTAGLCRPFSSVAVEKAHFNIGTIGHAGHGKSTLLAAIVHYLNKKTGLPSPNIPVKNKVSSFEIAEYETDTRKYTHIDCPGHPDYMKTVIQGANSLDAAIVVISAKDGIMAQTREQLLICKRLGVPYVIVFLSMADLVEESAVFDLSEIEIKHLISSLNFDMKSPFIIRGSALNALKGAENANEPIRKLLEVMDSRIGLSANPIEAPFSFPVDRAFSLLSDKHQGNVLVEGKVYSGHINVGDAVEIIGHKLSPSKATVTRLRCNKTCKLSKTGLPGEELTMALKKPGADCERGTTLVRPGTLKVAKQFDAEVRVLAVDEGGKKQPLKTNSEVQCYFNGFDVGATLILPENAKVALPGDCVLCKIRLDVPVPVGEGKGFVLREAGTTVGCGSIKKISDELREAAGEAKRVRRKEV